jgi:hypothetical protein
VVGSFGVEGNGRSRQIVLPSRSTRMLLWFNTRMLVR